MKSFFASAKLRLLLLPALLSTAGLLTTACSKGEDATPTQTYTDEELFQSFLTSNKITNAKKQPSGLYYIPRTTDSTAVRATAGKTVSVLYTGALMNGTVFDASSLHGNTPFSFVLGKGQVIAGWDEGIALMHKGDKAVLLIPSTLGYGAQAVGSIPANSPLYFEVQLTDVK